MSTERRERDHHSTHAIAATAGAQLQLVTSSRCISPRCRSDFVLHRVRVLSPRARTSAHHPRGDFEEAVRRPALSRSSTEHDRHRGCRTTCSTWATGASRMMGMHNGWSPRSAARARHYERPFLGRRRTLEPGSRPARRIGAAVARQHLQSARPMNGPADSALAAPRGRKYHAPRRHPRDRGASLRQEVARTGRGGGSSAPRALPFDTSRIWARPGRGAASYRRESRVRLPPGALLLT